MAVSLYMYCFLPALPDSSNLVVASYLVMTEQDSGDHCSLRLPQSAPKGLSYTFNFGVDFELFKYSSWRATLSNTL